MVWNFLGKPVLFFFPTPYLARAHVCRRFVFNPCPREATIQRLTAADHSLIESIDLHLKSRLVKFSS